MKVVFDDRAVSDLEDIYRFIVAHNPLNAADVTGRILASIETLADYPDMAREGVVAGTREWVIPGLPYIAVYRISRQTKEIVVIGIFHGARNRSSDK